MCCKKLILLLIVFGVLAGFSGVASADPNATAPYPAHEVNDVPVDVNLYWTPGDSVQSVDGQNLYFGEAFDDINDANIFYYNPDVIYRVYGGDVNDFDPPNSLDLGRTYYWRVDGVNDFTFTTWKGDVWSFTIVQPGIIVWDNETSTNLWKTALDWDLDIVPTAVLSARIMLDDPNYCTVDGTTAATAHSLKVGEAAGPGELLMTGGVLDIVGGYDGDLVVGANDVGIFDMTNGALTIADDLIIANSAGSADSNMTLSGGTVDVGDDLEVGDLRRGIFDMSGGSLTVGDKMTIADRGAAAGSLMTLSGTADVNVVGDFRVGYLDSGTLDMSDGALTIGDDLYIADQNGSGGSSMTMTGGTVIVSEDFYVGDDANGYFDISAGSLTTTGDKDAKIADGGGADGSTMTVTGTGTVYLADNALDVGEDGVGHLVISGDGSLTLGGDLIIADDANSDGSSMTLTSGSFTCDDLWVGDDALGTLTIADGNFMLYDDLFIAKQADANGSSMTITGGTVDIGGSLEVGEDGVGTLTISGGSLTNGSSDVKIADEGGGTASGSTMTISGTATVDFGKKLHVGRYSVGHLVMSGGTLTVVSEMSIGDRSNSDGSTMTMTSGTVTITNELRVGAVSTGILTMSGGTITVVGSALVIADEGGAGGSSMTMSGGSVDVTSDDFIVGDANVGTFTMSDGSLTVGDDLFIADGSDTGGSTMTLSGTADVNVNDDMLVGDDANGYLDMSGGSLTVGDDLIIADESGGAGSTMTLTSGTVYVGDDFYVGDNEYGYLDMSGGTITVNNDFEVENAGDVNLAGGTIEVLHSDDLHIDNGCNIDIKGGTLILDGNEVSTVQGYASNGWITGYGNPRGVVIDYNSVTNKTTVTATTSPSSSILALAYLPNPYNGETGVVIDPNLSWTPGDYAPAGLHRVNFGPDDPGNMVVIGTQGANTIPAGLLDLGKTYYWKVDEANGIGWDEGNVWHFTVINLLVVDNMESYADPSVDIARGAIRAVWKDGYAFTPETSGSNVTVSTHSDNRNPILVGDGPPWPNRGSEAMQFAYDNDGNCSIYVPGYSIATYSPDANYSEIAASTTGPNSLGIGPNWAGAGIKALVLWFYGDPDNDANEQMYVALDDGTDSNGVVNYDGDMNDIKIKAWQQWNIDLQDFNDQGVNLADINNVYIGFGIRGNTTTTGGSGVVYFDDIRLYGTRCVLSLRSDDFALVDFTGDCVVDGEELEVMAGDWLDSDGFINTLDPTDANLVAHYKFEQNTLCTIDSNNDGTPYGSPTYATGVVDVNAIELNGTDQYVEVTSNANLDLTKDFTIAAWVYPDVVSDRRTIVAKLTDVHDKQYALEIDDEEIEFEYELSSNNYAMSEGTVTAGSWQHLAVTIDSSLLINLYLNGASVGSETAPSEVEQTDEPVVIGRRSGTYNSGYFNGLIDDVRIYNRALSGTEVAYLADTTPGDGSLHVPIDSPADLFEDEPELSRYVNFKDFAVVAERWLDNQLFP